MNLVQQAEQLKMLPDAQLMQMQQQPTVVPPYLVLAEMQRRETMRKAATAGRDPVQQSTIAQDMTARMAGLQAQQPGMQQPQPTEPTRMANGGLARIESAMAQRMAGGGMLDQFFDYTQGARTPGFNPAAAMPTAMPTISPDMMPAMTRDQLNERYGMPTSTAAQLEDLRKVRGKSRLEDLAKQLETEERETRGKKMGLGEILMQLGLNMAASRRPDFLGALGEGGVGAFQGYMQNRFDRQRQGDALRNQRMGVMGQLEQSDNVLFREAGELARAANSGRNTEIMAGENARNVMLREAGDTERAAMLRKAQSDIAALNDRRERDMAAAKTEREKAETAAKYAQEERMIRLRASLERPRVEKPEDPRKQATEDAKLLLGQADSITKQIADMQGQPLPVDPKERAAMEEQMKKMRSAAAYYRTMGQRKMAAATGVQDPDVLMPSETPPPPPPPAGSGGSAKKQQPNSLGRLQQAISNIRGVDLVPGLGPTVDYINANPQMGLGQGNTRPAMFNLLMNQLGIK